MSRVYVHKAYINARGGTAIHNLTHDVKRCIEESQISAGQLNVLSTRGTCGVILLEKDEDIQKELLAYLDGQFAESSQDDVGRRSHTGANCFHHRATLVGLSLTLSFEQGRLLSSPFQEVYAIDFDPKPGRREFIITAVGSAAK